MGKYEKEKEKKFAKRNLRLLKSRPTKKRTQLGEPLHTLAKPFKFFVARKLKIKDILRIFSFVRTLYCHLSKLQSSDVVSDKDNKDNKDTTILDYRDTITINSKINKMFQSFYFCISVGLGTSVENLEQSYETTQRREKLHPEIEPRMAEPHDTGRYFFGQG